MLGDYGFLPPLVILLLTLTPDCFITVLLSLLVLDKVDAVAGWLLLVSLLAFAAVYSELESSAFPPITSSELLVFSLPDSVFGFSEDPELPVDFSDSEIGCEVV